LVRAELWDRASLRCAKGRNFGTSSSSMHVMSSRTSEPDWHAANINCCRRSLDHKKVLQVNLLQSPGFCNDCSGSMETRVRKDRKVVLKISSRDSKDCNCKACGQLLKHLQHKQCAFIHWHAPVVNTTFWAWSFDLLNCTGHTSACSSRKPHHYDMFRGYQV
jgi:hypothetical protein